MKRTSPLVRSVTRLLIGVSALAAAGLVGCTTPADRDRANQIATNAEERLRALTQENENLRRELDDCGSLTASQAGQISSLQQDLQSYAAQRDQLSSMRERIMKMDDQLKSLPSSGLSAETSLELANLAQRFRDLMTYDPERGLIQFRSDLTFDPGSDVVKAEARRGLDQLARVMATSGANGYYLHVVGHTDSQTISNPATKSKHPTNRHLSVHRAIAVSEALQKASVPVSADRILVGGWGQYDPVVPNNDKGGTAANRRVDIWILPLSERRAAGTMPVESTGSAAPVAAPVDNPSEEIPIK
ncbi:MAG: OmpA family protein [Phycisphaerales bacterium]|nr:OmpA family protein [Phycisphaerales bacterium]